MAGNNLVLPQKYEIYNGDAVKILQKFAKNGEKVDHIITDPPYNISQKNNFSTMKSANRTGVDFGDWDKGFNLTSWIAPATRVLKNGGTFIVFNSFYNLTPIIREMEKNGLIVKDLIRWTKTNPMPRNINRRYVVDTEFAIWAVKPGKPWVFNKPDDKPYLRAEFRTATVSGRERLGHPTQKSLNLMKHLAEIHTNLGEKILDPFMGSGTTGVAALENSRKFIGIELSPEYFAMAAKRLGGVK